MYWKLPEARLTIKASTPEGVFNGVQTLRQIIKEREGRLTVQKALVTDYPAFSWRAFSWMKVGISKVKSCPQSVG